MAMIELGTAKAAPGQKAWGQLPVKEGKKEVRLPVAVINGRRPGEHVVMLANQHGGEVNGVESIRRFVEAVDPKRVKGTIFAIPSANPRAAMLMNECWPEDEDETLAARFRGCPYLGPEGNRNNCKYNMNRKWPGKKGGLLVERMVYEIWNRAVMAPHRRADLTFDFHCHEHPSAVYAGTRKAIEFGIASGIRNIVHTRSTGTLATCEAVCHEHGIPSLTLELGGQYTLNETSIEDGCRAIRNLLKSRGMLPGRPEYPTDAFVLDPWRDGFDKTEHLGKSHIVYSAKHAGLALFRKGTYDLVRKGDVVCTITDPFTGRVVEECRAPVSGINYGVRIPNPACKPGTPLFILSIVRRVRLRMRSK